MSACAPCISLCLCKWGSCAALTSLSLGGLCNNLWCRLSLAQVQNVLDSHRPRISPDFKQIWHNLLCLTIYPIELESRQFEIVHTQQGRNPLSSASIT